MVVWGIMGKNVKRRIVMGIFDKFKKKEIKAEAEKGEERSKKTVYPKFLYSEQELDEYEKFIESQFGEFESVLHEIYSPDIHLDILIIPPNEKSNYYKLITMGAGAYKMNVPAELQQYQFERAEFMIFLPPDWDIKSSDGKFYWPIKELKSTARLPINCNTWLGLGHTVSSDAENTPYDESTKFCSMLLLNGLNQDFEKMNLKISGLGKINFYQLFPLYEDELKYKHENGLDALCELFDDDDLSPVLNIKRKNNCKK